MEFIKNIFKKIVKWFKKPENTELTDTIKNKIKEEIDKEISRQIDKISKKTKSK